MLVHSRFPSAYPVFAVLRVYRGKEYWRLMPSRLNASFDQYDLWAYTGQPVNPHDPAFAQGQRPPAEALQC
jgi:hypothetical protein